MTTAPEGRPPRGRRRDVARTDVRRVPEKQVRDRTALDALLDAALVAHVAVVEPAPDGATDGSTDGAPDDAPQPFVVPVGVARDGDRLLLHGSTASRVFRALATGAPTCATVTILDGVVLARSQFESSMSYRSAMVLGRCTELAGEAKERALDVLAQRLLPGVDDRRTPTRKELAATSVLALPIEEWSLKVSDKPGPEDDPADVDRPVWAGIVPLRHVWGTPVDAPDLTHDLPPHPAIADWPQGRT